LQEIKKILFLAEGQMGDSIVLTPALRAAKRSLPGAKVTILLFHRRKYINVNEPVTPYIEKSKFEGTAEVFRGNPDVDELLELDRKAMRSLRGFARLKAEWNCIRYLRKLKFDAAISTFPQNRFILWSFFAGIKRRIGERHQPFDYLLTDKPAIKRSDSGVLNYFCGLLKPFGITSQDRKTHYLIPPENLQTAEKLISDLKFDKEKKLLIIHPGASDKDRQIPPEKLAGVLLQMEKSRSYNLLLTYSEYDEEYVNAFRKIYTGYINYIQTVTIGQLAAILKQGDAALVHNSGPRHLAAAVGVKTVGLLEKYDDIMWKIYENEDFHAIVQSAVECSACSAGKCRGVIPQGAVYGAKCMHDISAEAIYSSIERIINNP